MNNSYLENREKKNYRVSLYKPSGEYQGKLLVDNVNIQLKLGALSTISFNIPEYIQGVLNPRLNEVLDSFEIEFEFGDLESSNFQKEKFIIRKRPLSFSNNITNFQYEAVSKEVILENIKLVSWPGIKKIRYYETTTSNFASTIITSVDPRIESFSISGIINDLETIQVFRIDTKTETEILLLEAGALVDVNETNYYYDGNDFHVGIPSQVEVDTTILSDTYNYRVYYEADSQAIGAATDEYYTKDGLSLAEIAADILDGTPYSVGTITTSLSDIYRSNFKFNNKSKYKAIQDITKAFDAIVVFDNVNFTANFYKVEEYGEDKGLTLKYGKYLSQIEKNIDSSSIATVVRAMGKNNLSLAGATATGENAWEDYSYFLDGAAIDGSNNLVSSSRWMSDSLSRALLIWLKERDSYDNELYNEVDGLLRALYDEVALLVTKNDTLIEYDAKIFNATSLRDTYIESGQTNTSFERNFNGVNYTDPLVYFQAKIDFYTTEKVPYQSEYDALESSVESKQVRLDQIKANLDKDLFFTPEQKLELSIFTREIVFKESTIDDYLDLLDEAKTFLDDYKEPQITVDVNVIDILQAGEASADWDKIILGDKLNVYFPRFNIDLEAQIKEISMNLDSFSMNLKISTVKRYNKDVGTFLGKTLRRLQESENNEVDYNADQRDEDASSVEKFRELQQTAYDTATGTKINAGKKDNNENSSLVIDENGLELTALEVNLETEQIEPKAGSKIRMINGGIYIVDENDNVETAITIDGISAAQLVGEILLGEQLTIKDTFGEFYLGNGGGDSDLPVGDFGLTLQGILSNTTVTNRIVISKKRGFRIEQSASGNFDDTAVIFAADANGDVIFSGKLKSSNDTIYTIDDLADLRFEFANATRFTSYTESNTPLYSDLGNWELTLYLDGVAITDYTNIGAGNPTIESIVWDTSGNITGAASNTRNFTPGVGAYSANGGVVEIEVNLVGINKTFKETIVIPSTKQAAAAGAKYTWIKYSNEAYDGSAPSAITDLASAATQQIGMAFNKDSNVESTDPADYEWSAYKGLDGDVGADGYAILCSNEAITIAADNAGNVLSGQDTTSKIQLLVGASSRNLIVQLNGATSGCDATIDNTDSKEIVITLTNFTTDNGYAKFDILDDDDPSNIKVGEKVITFSKARKGEIGYNILIDNESGTIIANQDGVIENVSPFTITPKLYSGNSEITVDSLTVSGQVNCNASVDTGVITVTPLKSGDAGYADYTEASVVINIEKDSITYQRIFKATVVKVGSDTYTLLLSNETASIPADKDGNIDNGYIEETTVSVYRGSEKLTSGYTITNSGGAITGVDCGGTVVGDLISIGNFTDGVNNGSLEIQVTIDNTSVVLTKIFTFSVSRNGETGEDGADSLEVSLDNEADVFSIPNGYDFISAYDVNNKVVTMRINKPGFTVQTAPVVTPVGMELVSNTPSIASNTATITIDKVTAASGYVDITITASNGQPYTRRFTFTTVEKGDTGATGASGSDAKVVKLTTTEYVIVYDADGLNPVPAGPLTISANSQNFADAWFKFTGSAINDETDFTVGAGQNNDTIQWTPPTNYFSTPKTIRVGVSEGDQVEVAFDTITITAVKPGKDGTNGEDGTPGQDAIQYYTHIGYADDDSGTGYSTSPVGKIYFAVLVSTSDTVVVGDFDGKWQKYIGSDGGDGAPGTPGTDGTSYYVHIRYADSLTPANYAATYSTQSGHPYVGIYSGTESDPSNATIFSFYEWNKIEGTDGEKGDTGDNGKDALTIIISNESHSMPKDKDDVVDYSGSGTIIRLYEGATELVYDGVGTSDGSWKVTTSPTNITVGAITDGGNHAVVADHSDMLASSASITYTIIGKRADGTAISITKTQSFSQSIQGAQGIQGESITGEAGYSNAIIYLYKRATSASKGTITGTYTFSTKTISLTENTGSWSTTIPAGNDPIFVIAASVASQTDSASFDENDFSAPVVMAQDGYTPQKGTDYDDGAPGLNIATVYVYKRGSSAPTDKPEGDTTFTFATGGISFTTPNGWSSEPTGSGDNLYVRIATAAANTATDIIEDTEWSDVKLMAAKGEDSTVAGPTGETGKRTISGYLYYNQAAATAPTAPTTNYTFGADGDAAFSALGNWSTNPPTHTADSNDKFWYVYFNGEETASESGITDNLSFGLVTQSVSFEGMVTFSELSSELNNESGTEITSIHGGLLKTAVIKSNNYDAPDAGETFADAGMEFDMNAGKITAKNFLMDASGNVSIKGSLEVGQASFFKTSGKDGYSDNTAGMWIGYDTDAYKMFLGDATTYLKWSGSALSISGSLEIGSTSYIRTAGKDSYTDNTAGLWIGYNDSKYKMYLGDSTNHIKWDGADLLVQGDIGGSIGAINVGNITITAAGIEAKNASNVQQFFLDASDGSAFFKGEIEADSGKIGGWTLESSYMYYPSATQNLQALFKNTGLWFGIDEDSGTADLGGLSAGQEAARYSHNSFFFYHKEGSGGWSDAQISQMGYNYIWHYTEEIQDDFTISTYGNLVLRADISRHGNYDSVYAWIGDTETTYGGLVQTNGENISSKAIKTNIIDISNEEIKDALDNLKVVRYQNILNEEEEISIIIEDSVSRLLAPEIIANKKTAIRLDEDVDYFNESSMLDRIPLKDGKIKYAMPQLNMKSYASLGFVAAQYNDKRIKELEEENAKLRKDIDEIKTLLGEMFYGNN